MTKISADLHGHFYGDTNVLMILLSYLQENANVNRSGRLSENFLISGISSRT